MKFAAVIIPCQLLGEGSIDELRLFIRIAVQIIQLFIVSVLCIRDCVFLVSEERGLATMSYHSKVQS